MNFLFVGPDVANRRDVSNFSGAWSHYLTRTFREMGHGVRFDAGSEDPEHFAALDLRDVDHVLALGSRYWGQRPAACVMALRSHFRGRVTQLCERPVADQPAGVITFTVRGVARHNSVPTGWAADAELLQPRQGTDLTILVDHPTYGEPGRMVDNTTDILSDARNFASKSARKIRVRRIVDGGVIDAGMTMSQVGVFTRRHIPFEDIAAEYGQAHVFLVTHPEAVGLTVLETALAGALPVVPYGFIDPGLLRTVRHVAYSGPIPWPEVLASIDPAASRAAALPNSWAAVASKILSFFESTP